MISSEVQRTLVKSPPELWAELSDPAALARHLGELGEIRITRSEPEKRVEWEAEGTSGSVLIKPSGWGTKVTLSVTREIDAPAQETTATVEPESEQVAEAPTATADTEPGPRSESESESESDHPAEAAEPTEASAESGEPETPVALDTEAVELRASGIEAEAEPAPSALEPEAAGEPENGAASEAATSPTPASEPITAPAPRRGFFARLFGRRQPKLPEPADAPLEEPAAEAPRNIASVEEGETEEAASPEEARIGSAIELLQARFQAEPAAEADEPSEEPQDSAPEPPRDLAAELKAAEEVAAEEVTAVLTAVLDRLGAAHHRPFSRA